MNPILQLLKEANISDEQIRSIFEELTTNPLMAMATIGQLGLAPEKLQPVMTQVMMNPDLIKQAVDELGLDYLAVEKAKDQLNNR